MATKMTRRGKTVWVARVQREGEIKARHFKTKTEALDWEAEVRALKTWNETTLQPLAATTTVTALHWTNAYLDHVKDRKMTEKTYHEKVVAFARLFKVYPRLAPVELITIAHAYDLLRKRARGSSGYAANKDRKNLVAAWGWGIKYLGLPEKNPFKAVDRFGEERQPRYVPSEDDFWLVYNAAENDQDRVMLMTYLHTAARKSEILKLRWDDVDFHNHKIRLWTRKRRGGNLEADWIPMTQQLGAALHRHRATAKSVFVFCRERGQRYTARQHWLRYLCGKANVKYFTLHSIRHLTASLLDQAGVPLAAIQAILRHKSATTTARYMHDLRGTAIALDGVFQKNGSVCQNDKSPLAAIQRA